MSMQANIAEAGISHKELLSVKTKNNLLGLFWKLTSCLAFAGVNAIVRYRLLSEYFWFYYSFPLHAQKWNCFD
jgi:hypothetical protein